MAKYLNATCLRSGHKLAWRIVATAIILLLSASCAIQEPKFEATGASVRRAILRGETKEALAFNESTALEAERQKHWETATNAYLQASDLARNSGQIQNAIKYAEKALEMAKRLRMERLQLNAIHRLNE